MNSVNSPAFLGFWFQQHRLCLPFLSPPIYMHSLVRRVTPQLSNCDAHDLTLLALGLAVLGPTLTRGWVRRFKAALQRQPTSLDLQLQV